MRRNGMGQEWRTENQTFTQPKRNHNYISISKPSNLQTKVFPPYLIVTWDHIKINHKKLSVWAHQPWPALAVTDPSLLCTQSGSAEVQVQWSLENGDRCVEMSANGCKYALSSKSITSSGSHTPLSIGISVAHTARWQEQPNWNMLYRVLDKPHVIHYSPRKLENLDVSQHNSDLWQVTSYNNIRLNNETHKTKFSADAV